MMRVTEILDLIGGILEIVTGVIGTLLMVACHFLRALQKVALSLEPIDTQIAI